MSASEIVNWGEVFLWPAFGLLCLFFAFRGKGAPLSNKRLWTLAPAFFVFGASDYIELRTGAWWDPPWLLAMKAACLVVFAAVAWGHCRDKGKR